MEEYKLEKWIIIVLWVGMVVSFSLTLLAGYRLLLSDVIGFFGLITVSAISYFKKSLSLYALLILLFFGVSNMATFNSFFHEQVRYGSLGQEFTPGMQLYSLIFFAILATLRRAQIIEGFKKMLQVSDEDKQSEFDKNVLFYKSRFEALETTEIEQKLQADLSEEALTALQLLLDERNL